MADPNAAKPEDWDEQVRGVVRCGAVLCGVVLNGVVSYCMVWASCGVVLALCNIVRCVQNGRGGVVEYVLCRCGMK